MVALLQQDLSNGGLGGHARCEGIACNAAFESGHAEFEREARGILRPRVLVGVGFAYLVLDVGGSLKDGDGDSAGGRIRFLSRMNRIGSETHDFLLAEVVF